VLRAGPADVIAYAFYQVGYRPRESLVLIGIHGPRLRLGLVIRVDLPPRRYLRAVFQQQLDTLREFGHDALMALVVSDAAPPPGSDPGDLPHRRLARDLRRQARRQGVGVQDVIAVGEHSWRSYSCTEPSCCPPGGRPLAEVLAGRLATTMICEGRVLAPDEASLVADVAPAPPAAAGPGSAERAPAEPGSAGVPPVQRVFADPDARVADAPALLQRWRELLAVREPSPGSPAEPSADLGWLGEALQDRWLRDAVLFTLVPGSGTAPEELLAGSDDAVLDGLLDQRPDPELLERGRMLLSAVARSAPPGARVEALALLAWMSWWAGDGARGRLLAGRALDDRPGHRLARLVDGLLRAGVAPGWAHGAAAARVQRSG